MGHLCHLPHREGNHSENVWKPKCGQNALARCLFLWKTLCWGCTLGKREARGFYMRSRIQEHQSEMFCFLEISLQRDLNRKRSAWESLGWGWGVGWGIRSL